MKKSAANAIKNVIKRQCKDMGIPYEEAYYRRAKKAYASIPSTKRHLVG